MHMQKIKMQRCVRQYISFILSPYLSPRQLETPTHFSSIRSVLTPSDLMYSSHPMFNPRHASTDSISRKSGMMTA